MAEELDETIRENAAGPAKASGDSGSMEQHKPSEIIEADKYLLAKKAMASPTLGLRRAKIVAPGSV